MADVPEHKLDVPAGKEAEDASSSMALLHRAQAGDRDAIEQLVARYLPRLRRWAHGRLPRYARDLADTSDLVQETVVRTFHQIERFEVRGEGALQAYLRQALMNRIRDEVRRATRRPLHREVDAAQRDEAASPLELAVGRELLDRYEQALGELRPEDREAIIGRVELHLSYAELADTLGKPSANAARMAVERALVRLACAMSDEASHEPPG